MAVPYSHKVGFVISFFSLGMARTVLTTLLRALKNDSSQFETDRLWRSDDMSYKVRHILVKGRLRSKCVPLYAAYGSCQATGHQNAAIFLWCH